MTFTLWCYDVLFKEWWGGEVRGEEGGEEVW